MPDFRRYPATPAGELRDLVFDLRGIAMAPPWRWAALVLGSLMWVVSWFQHHFTHEFLAGLIVVFAAHSVVGLARRYAERTLRPIDFWRVGIRAITYLILISLVNLLADLDIEKGAPLAGIAWDQFTEWLLIVVGTSFLLHEAALLVVELDWWTDRYGVDVPILTPIAKRLQERANAVDTSVPGAPPEQKP